MITKLRNITIGLYCLALILLLGACAFGGEKIAMVTCGGTAPPGQFIGNHRTWADGCIAWALKYGPVIQENGFTRVSYHNPGGHFNLDGRTDADGIVVMHANQWQLAQQAGAPYAVDDELAAMHTIMRRQFGVTEQIYYLGGPADFTPKQMLEFVRPFLLDGSSLCFDAANKVSDVKSIVDLGRAIRRTGWEGRIYLEAFPQMGIDPKDYKNQVDGVVALNRFIYGSHPRPEHLERAPLFGEVMMIPDSFAAEDAGQADTWPEFVTPILRRWK